MATSPVSAVSPAAIIVPSTCTTTPSTVAHYRRVELSVAMRGTGILPDPRRFFFETLTKFSVFDISKRLIFDIWELLRRSSHHRNPGSVSRNASREER